MYNNFKNHIITYLTPLNIFFIFLFDFLASFMLVNQMFIDLFIAMFYFYKTANVFNNIKFIMININYGWFYSVKTNFIR